MCQSVSSKLYVYYSSIYNGAVKVMWALSVFVLTILVFRLVFPASVRILLVLHLND